MYVYVYFLGRVRPGFDLLMNTPPSSINYQPKFADNITFSSPELERNATSLCGQNTICLFDAAATDSIAIGVQSRTVNQINTQAKNELGR